MKPLRASFEVIYVKRLWTTRLQGIWTDVKLLMSVSFAPLPPSSVCLYRQAQCCTNTAVTVRPSQTHTQITAFSLTNAICVFGCQSRKHIITVWSCLCQTFRRKQKRTTGLEKFFCLIFGLLKLFCRLLPEVKVKFDLKGDMHSSKEVLIFLWSFALVLEVFIHLHWFSSVLKQFRIKMLDLLIYSRTKQ